MAVAPGPIPTRGPSRAPTPTPGVCGPHPKAPEAGPDGHKGVDSRGGAWYPEINESRGESRIGQVPTGCVPGTRQMSQFEVIRDITKSLEELLKASLSDKGFTTVNVVTDRPKKENIKNLPTVSCYLYHVAFAPGYKERTSSLVSTQTRGGEIVEYYLDAPVYLHAHFILSVWGNSPQEENLLLGLVVKTFLEHPLMEGDLLHGESFFPDEKINVYPNLQSDYNDVLTFWRSMGEDVRPSVYYYVKFRIESERRSEDVKRVIGKKVALRP